jgi:predicted molibdopterin-dependent oxidoreductase YjgC
VLLPSAAWSEADGTIVNFEGRIQRVRRCHLPRGEGRPGWRVARDLAEAAGLEMPQWTDSAEVLASLAERVAQYRGIDVESIGLLGAASSGGA